MSVTWAWIIVTVMLHVSICQTDFAVYAIQGSLEME